MVKLASLVVPPRTFYNDDARSSFNTGGSVGSLPLGRFVPFLRLSGFELSEIEFSSQSSHLFGRSSSCHRLLWSLAGSPLRRYMR